MNKESITNYFEVVEDPNDSTNFLIVLRNFDIFDGITINFNTIKINELENGAVDIIVDYEILNNAKVPEEKQEIFENYLTDIIHYLINLQLENNINIADLGKNNTKESNQE